MKKKVSKKKKPDILRFWRDAQDKSDAKIKGYIDIQRTKSDEDTRRYIGALSEDFQGQVKVIAEQYGDINKKLDSHGEMIGKLAVDMEVVKTNVEFMKDSLKKKVDYDEFNPLKLRVHALETRGK